MLASPGHRNLLRLAATALAVGSLQTAPIASAQTAGEVTVARRLFKEATALEADGKWAAAAAKLRTALAIKETAGLRYHLAVCEEQQVHLVEAQLEYDRAQELLDRGEKASDVARLLKNARAKLEGRVPSVRLLLPDEPADLTLSLDGRPLKRASTSAQLPLNPGKHQIRAEAPGYGSFETVLVLAEGEHKTVAIRLTKVQEVSPKPPSAVSAPEPKLDPSSSDARTWVLLSEAAVALVGFGVGVAYQLDANSAADEAARARESLEARPGGAAACGDPTLDSNHAEDCDQLTAFQDQKRESDTFALIGLGVGAVGLASLVITWLAWESPHPSRKPAASLTRPRARRPRLLAGSTPGGGWIGLSGRF